MAADDLVISGTSESIAQYSYACQGSCTKRYKEASLEANLLQNYWMLCDIM